MSNDYKVEMIAETGNFNITHNFLAETKHILLVCKEGDIQEKTVNYAQNLCQRSGATLNVFYWSQGIAARQCFETLVHYVKKKTTIICTVISHVNGLDMSHKWTINGCPLIIVKESVLGNYQCLQHNKNV